MKRKIGVFMPKELKFEYMNYWNVDICLRDRITELSGDTATGKSFIYSVIEHYTGENKIQDIKCLDKSFYSKLDKNEILNKLKTYKNSIVVIDQANSILRYDEIEEFISYDYDSNNYYLLIGRTLPTTTRYTEMAKPDIHDRKLSIKYNVKPAV